jgi:hypothetical protein
MTKPTPKRETERGAAYARGGKGDNQKMLGRGDRTVTATLDSAGEQTAGQTANRSKNNLTRAKGGRRIDNKWGIAYPAQPGMCGPAKPGGGR